MKNLKVLIIAVVVCYFQAVQALPFESQNFSITGPSPYLKDTIQAIHKKGGNIVDMAVAGAFTLSVVTPFYVSLGAGGFALVDMGGEISALDFREKAPQALGKNYYYDKSSVLGGSAVGVPGFVAGMYSLQKKYGRLKWDQIFHTALILARKGYVVNGEWASVTKKIKKKNYGMEVFFNKDKAYKPGEVFKQPKLFRALKTVQRKGREGFYQGSVAQDIVNTVKKYDGDMTLKDLNAYKVRWLQPMKKNFMGYNIHIMPPPSSGSLVIFSALDLIEQKKLNSYPPLSSNELHLLSEIMSKSFRLRNFTGDPDFHLTPFEKLLSPSSLKQAGDSISVNQTSKENLKETTHLIVMDRQGRTVTMTLTLNLNYGSKTVTSDYGIVLNNQMDDFTTRENKPNSFGLVQGKANFVQAGKRPVSSMSPTIVKKGGETVMALGGSGGPRIINGVLQTLYRSLVNKMDVDQAVQYPRIHHQFFPHLTYVEKNRISPDVLNILRQKGHSIKEVEHLGKIYGIFRTEDRILKSAFDHRGEGLAWGL